MEFLTTDFTDDTDDTDESIFEPSLPRLLHDLEAKINFFAAKHR